MKKIKIIGITIIVIILAIQIAKHILKTPVFYGKILDVTTGQPVENAIITAIWWKSKSEGANPFHSVTVITGKDGKYSIPEYTRIYGSNLYTI